MGKRYDPIIFFLKNIYDVWFENEESTYTTRFGEEFADLSSMPSLEGDEEEVKERKELKMWAPYKLLTKLPILIAQIKALNNLNKLKHEIRQIPYLLYQNRKSPKKFIPI